MDEADYWNFTFKVPKDRDRSTTNNTYYVFENLYNETLQHKLEILLDDKDPLDLTRLPTLELYNNVYKYTKNEGDFYE